MPNVPHRSRSRSSHRMRTRATHDYDASMEALTSGAQTAEQASIDEIPISPKFTNITSFASSIRPVAVVDVLPTLPDANYPEFTYAVLTSDERLYKNINEVWVKGVDGADIVADSITAGQIAAGAISTTELAAEAVTTEKLAAGEITLYDASGATLLTPLGFGPVWQRFLMTGLVNGDFFAAPPTPGDNLDQSTNPLPGWTFTKVSGTAINFKSVVDTGTGSGRKIEMVCASGAANDESRIEQITPVVASINRGSSFSPYIYVDTVTGSADVELVFKWQFLKSDASTTGTEESFVIASNHALLLGGTELGLTTLSGHGLQPPADSYYVRFRIILRRKSGGSTSATATVHLLETYIIRGTPRIHVPEANFGFGFERGTIQQSGGNIIITPDSQYSGTDARAVRLIGVLENGSNTFPTAPSLNQMYFRTDLLMWFVYDGTRWVSELMSKQFGFGGTVNFPISATHPSSLVRADLTAPYGTDIWVEKVTSSWKVESGGSALSGSHKWVCAFVANPVGNITGTPVDASSGSSNVWRSSTITVGALANGDFSLGISATKTGTPGDFTIHPTLYYRIVAT